MAFVKNMSLAVKSDLNGDKRRFTFESTDGMAGLQQKLATIYNAGELTLKYEDDEHDLVTLKTDDDLVEALKCFEGALPFPPLRVTVNPNTPAPAPAPAVPQPSANFQVSGRDSEVMELICRGLDQFKLMKHQYKQASHYEKVQEKANKAQGKEPAGLESLRSGLPYKQGNPVKQMARFVHHVTLPEGEKVPAGKECTKTWRVRNDSPHWWPVGSNLVLVSGKNADNLTAAESFPVGVALAPGEETELSVDVVAPAMPGFYQGFWRLQGPKGRKFGQRLGCSILVTEADGAVISSSEDDADRDPSNPMEMKKKKKEKQKPPTADPTAEVEKLAALRAMGYADEALMVKCLRKCDSNVERAAAKLANKQQKLANKVDQVAKKLAALTAKQGASLYVPPLYVPPAQVEGAAAPPAAAVQAVCPPAPAADGRAAESRELEVSADDFEMVDKMSPTTVQSS